MSEGNDVFGEIVGVIFPISQKQMYVKALENMKKDHPKSMPYFTMAQNTSYGLFVSILYVGSDPDLWNDEGDDLEMQSPYAYVYNIDEEFSEIGSVHYEMFNGGPIRTQ